MNAQERAQGCLYRLFNDADHVRQLVENAQYSLKYGRVAEALESLEIANRPAGLIEMRLGDAIDALRKLPATPEGK